MRQNISFKKIYYFLLCIFFFLLPTNLFLKFNLSSAYVNGLLIDYLIPKLYLSDMFVLLLLALWSIEVIFFKRKRVKFSFKKKNLPFVFFLFLFIARQFFTPHPLAASWYLLKILEVGCLGWFFQTHKNIFQRPLIYLTVIFTLGFQSFLAIWQIFTQKSLLGYMFFGEPNFSHSIGLAKDAWWDTGRILPYGTTAHPNILGGVLAVYSLYALIWCLKKPLQKWQQALIALTLVLAIFALFLTQSISALASLGIGVLLILSKKINTKILNTGSLMLFFIIPYLIQIFAPQFKNSDSLARRAYLQTAAVQMSLNNPIWGVGLNQFTSRVEEFSQTKEIVRFTQPVHHLGLLWLAETGVLGVILILILGKKIKINQLSMPLLILLPIAALDHYLLTQQTGLLLSIFALFLINFKHQQI